MQKKTLIYQLEITDDYGAEDGCLSVWGADKDHPVTFVSGLYDGSMPQVHYLTVEQATELGRHLIAAAEKVKQPTEPTQSDAVTSEEVRD